MSNKYKIDPRYQLWTKEGFEYAFVIEPLGHTLIMAASQRAMQDMADEKPKQPTETLADGTEQPINTEDYKQALLKWNTAVSIETQNRIDSIALRKCIKVVLTGSAKAWKPFDWQSVVDTYREDNADLSEILDLPEDDLDLLVRCIILPSRTDLSDLLDHCANGQTVEDRVQTFQHSA